MEFSSSRPSSPRSTPPRSVSPPAMQTKEVCDTRRMLEQRLDILRAQHDEAYAYLCHIEEKFQDTTSEFYQGAYAMYKSAEQARTKAEEDAYHRVDFLNDAKSCEAYCDYLENLIYNYTKQNSHELDMQLVNETQHIIIRCARKSNKLLSDELKYYLKQILENVRQKPTSPLPPPSQSNSNRKTKKNKRNFASPIMENSEPKKSKQVTNSDLSDVESMHSASSSSEEESEIETKTSTKPETAQTEENNDSDTENNNGFTVVTRKKRVPPIIIDESMNTPELLKELSEKTGNKDSDCSDEDKSSSVDEVSAILSRIRDFDVSNVDNEIDNLIHFDKCLEIRENLDKFIEEINQFNLTNVDYLNKKALILELALKCSKRLNVRNHHELQQQLNHKDHELHLLMERLTAIENK
ncbi:hypothetical protein NPIL_446071 [Nephila pilipes]|uniref:Uncharacterized protein n=2 Tax=Nephila pilipes TaxID=299642 RepID=A0A8X6TDX6_NEPPI|nr:hypothetical protein NPIL_446071 [Nephila pilipes]